MTYPAFYKAPIRSGEFDVEIKRSRFLVRYTPIESKDEADAFIRVWKKAYPDARHHCWAYVIDNPDNPSAMTMSDDGEPTGTAGRPMLNALQGKGVGDICVVVIRYFGGTKLGAGGLIRAYGGSVSQAMDKAEFETVTPKLHCVICGDFAYEAALRHWLSVNGGKVNSVEYGTQVQLSVSIEVLDKNALEEFLAAHAMQFFYL